MPVLGLATAASLHVLTDAWVLVAVALTALAATVLVGLVLPLQRRLLAPAAPDVGGPGQVTAAQTALTTRLMMTTGAFNLLWVAVTVLMVWRPGSTTGV